METARITDLVYLLYLALEDFLAAEFEMFCLQAVEWVIKFQKKYQQLLKKFLSRSSTTPSTILAHSVGWFRGIEDLADCT